MIYEKRGTFAIGKTLILDCCWNFWYIILRHLNYIYVKCTGVSLGS